MNYENAYHGEKNKTEMWAIGTKINQFTIVY